MIVGAGFAGLEVARRLRDKPFDVLVVDRNNYHTFTPLLYQVATAGLDSGSIVKPVRSILRRASNVRFQMAEVRDIDLDGRRLRTERGDIDYDYLVLATGSVTNYFGSRDLEENTLTLKDLDDAIQLRSKVLFSFEQAVLEPDAETRRRLMTIVIVGGGPTGVEMAGAIAELRRHVLPKDFPQLDVARESRVVLLEATGAVLPGFPPSLQRSAVRQLEELGVEVRLNSAVESARPDGVSLKGGESLDAATVIWVAGVRASELGGMLGLNPARGGRAPVTPALQHPDHPEVFIAGDLAAAEHQGRPLAMMAPVAIQEGKAVAENLERVARGAAPVPFRYNDKGVMATIGRQRAVAYVRPLKLSGFAAWVTWLTVHLFWLIGFRNKLLVMVEWAWNYFFYEQGSRLITRRYLKSKAPDFSGIPKS